MSELEPQKIEAQFDKASYSQSDFLKRIAERYNVRTANKVAQALEQLQLPIPQLRDEYLYGTDGFLLFLEKFGVVLRLEDKKKNDLYSVIENAHLIPALCAVEAGDLVIEICPGGACESITLNDAVMLRQTLYEDNLHFWDIQAANCARIPLKTVSFPTGIPVVIDRPSVKALDYVVKIEDAVGAAHRKAFKVENLAEIKNFYAPLVQAFKEAWPDKGNSADVKKMNRAWGMAEQYTTEKKLIAGWMTHSPVEKLGDKPSSARRASVHYGETLAQQSSAANSPANTAVRKPQ